MPPRKRPRLEPRQRPRRRLPDLCLIALFKQLEPKDQVKASRMNSRCAILVRAANRRVRKLVITDWDNYEGVKRYINYFSLASKPSIQQLADVNEPLVGDYPMTTHINKYNCMHVRDLPITEELVTIFSAVTDLKFIARANNKKHCQYLVDLLRHPNWAGQLTSLMFDNLGYCTLIESPKDLIIRDAINFLPALEYLAINFGSHPIPELPILAQLKVISVKMLNCHLSSFLDSLERLAAANGALKMHLLPHCNINNLLSLSEPLCNRIARIEGSSLVYRADNFHFCLRFSSLTSLSVGNIYDSNVGTFFTTLSQLSQLVHLKLSVDFVINRSPEELPWSSRPQAQVNSVRALDLKLAITSHSQVSWLNLQQTLPHLQVIHLQYFECKSCKIKHKYIYEGVNCSATSATRECLRASLLAHLHQGVHPGRVFFQYSYDRIPSFSFEQL